MYVQKYAGDNDNYKSEEIRDDLSHLSVVPPGNNRFGKSSSRGGALTGHGRRRALQETPRVAATAAPAPVAPSQPRRAEPRGDKWSSRECAKTMNVRPVALTRRTLPKRKEKKEGCKSRAPLAPRSSSSPAASSRTQGRYALHPPPSPTSLFLRASVSGRAVFSTTGVHEAESDDKHSSRFLRPAFPPDPQ